MIPSVYQCISNGKSIPVTPGQAFPFLTDGKHCVSVVGAGGKSSLIDCMAAEAAKQGRKVLVTTTTHIFRPNDSILAENKEALQKIWKEGHRAVIGAEDEKNPQKLTMPEHSWLRQAMEMADLILIEADGSKRMPCKVPADHEPVILPESDIVIGVLGMSSLGQPLKTCCFRLEEATRVLQTDEKHVLNEENIAYLLRAECGLKKSVGVRKYWPVLNQCDDSERRYAGERIGRILQAQGMEQLLMTKLR